MRARTVWIFAAVLLLVISACAPAGGGTTATPPAPSGGDATATPPVQGGTMPSLGFSTPLPRKMTEPLEQAVHDLTVRLGISADDIELVSITTEEMPAGDLCPGVPAKGTAQPGGLVLGKEIILRVGTETYTYRVAGKRVALCRPPASGEVPAPPTTLLPEGSEVAVEKALADLATRLNVDKGAIQVVSVEKRMWSDAGLGCPQPGMMYAQVITPGFLIRLNAQGKTYTYHTSLTHAVLCEP